jgi:hypothetical protein
MHPGIVFGATSAMEIKMPFCYINWSKMSKVRIGKTEGIVAPSLLGVGQQQC